MEKRQNFTFIDFANNEMGLLEEKPRDGLAKNVELLARGRMGLKECDVPEVREHLKNVLEGIISSKCLNDSEGLRYFTEIKKKQRLEYRVENGRLIEEWCYDEGGVYPYQLQAVFSSLINFLTNHDSDFKKLMKCPYCEKFFIAKTARREVCYRSGCLKEQRRLFKQHQRNVDPYKYM